MTCNLGHEEDSMSVAWKAYYIKVGHLDYDTAAAAAQKTLNPRTTWEFFQV